MSGMYRQLISLFLSCNRLIDLFKFLFREGFDLMSSIERLILSAWSVSFAMVKLKSLLVLEFLQTIMSGVPAYLFGLGSFSSLFFTPKWKNYPGEVALSSTRGSVSMKLRNRLLRNSLRCKTEDAGCD